MTMLEPRKTIKLVTWPDPLVQERLEDMGFFYDETARTWVRYCDQREVASVGEWLKRHHLQQEVVPARGRGELKKHPKLSDVLLLKDGGGTTSCALCGAQGVACRQWVEGDDTDSIDYPSPAKFYLCGSCVQIRMQPHPRLYTPAEDQL
jgi:hypothetical protein